MSKRAAYVLIVIAFFAGAGVGVLVFTYLVGGSGEPSRPVTAPTLSVESSPEATEAATDDPPASNSGASNRVLFRIVPDESQVRFQLTEVLFGNPNTVIGTTTEVAGDLIVDFATPANSQVGAIVVNARTLAADNEFRNRAIRTQILESRLDEYEFVNFAPTELSGLPASITLGQPVTFQITGDLKIRNITRSITFDATVTPVSEARLEGAARTTVTRADFDLRIPNAPGVADVAEEVILEINFVAMRVEE